VKEQFYGGIRVSQRSFQFSNTKGFRTGCLSSEAAIDASPQSQNVAAKNGGPFSSKPSHSLISRRNFSASLIVPFLFPRSIFASQESSATAVNGDRYFEFHSGFWINLHLFLYLEAVTRKGARDVGREAEFTSDSTISATLNGDDKTNWDAAVAYYQANLIGLDLLTNDKMRAIKNTLENLENESSVSRASLNAGVIHALDGASSVYRTHFWPAHDKANRDWIAAVTPLVDQNGDQLALKLSSAYETPWPDTPLRVDAVAYANSSGAFTTLHPTRITISSQDPSNQKLTSLESLFHEASHTMVEAAGNLILNDYAGHRKTAPPDLLHAILYFTTGYYMTQIYSDYIPYADGNNLWQQVAWAGFHDAIVKDWQPHLDGKSTARDALSQLVVDVLAATR
jgi:hypothetical protein